MKLKLVGWRVFRLVFPVLVVATQAQSLLASEGLDSAGATGVVCYASKRDLYQKNEEAITSIELLDLHEALYPKGMAPAGESVGLVKPTDSESEEDYAVRLISRLRIAFPNLYGKIKEAARSFPLAADFQQIPGGTRFIDDVGLVGKLDGKFCALANLATQETHNNVTRVYLNSRLVFHPKMGEWSRKLIYAHEFLYFVGRSQFDQKYARGTREVLGALLRTQITAAELASVVAASDFLADADRSFANNNWTSPTLNFAADQTASVIREELARLVHDYCAEAPARCEGVSRELKAALDSAGLSDVVYCLNGFELNQNIAQLQSCVGAAASGLGVSKKISNAYSDYYDGGDFTVISIFFPPMVLVPLFDGLSAGMGDQKKMKLLNSVSKLANGAFVQEIQKRLKTVRGKLHEQVLARYLREIQPWVLSQTGLDRSALQWINNQLMGYVSQGDWLEAINFSLDLSYQLPGAIEKLKNEVLPGLSKELIPVLAY